MLVRSTKCVFATPGAGASSTYSEVECKWQTGRLLTKIRVLQLGQMTLSSLTAPKHYMSPTSLLTLRIWLRPSPSSGTFSTWFVLNNEKCLPTCLQQVVAVCWDGVFSRVPSILLIHATVLSSQHLRPTQDTTGGAFTRGLIVTSAESSCGNIFHDISEKEDEPASAWNLNGFISGGTGCPFSLALYIHAWLIGWSTKGVFARGQLWCSNFVDASRRIQHTTKASLACWVITLNAFREAFIQLPTPPHPISTELTPLFARLRSLKARTHAISHVYWWFASCQNVLAKWVISYFA